jgi:hypothetical protein
MLAIRLALLLHALRLEIEFQNSRNPQTYVLHHAPAQPQGALFPAAKSLCN